MIINKNYTNAMFWNDECNKYSQYLWKPGLKITHVPSFTKHFNCTNKHISFNYFTDSISINPKLQFKNIPSIDNSSNKLILQNKLEKAELNRFCNELSKTDSKNSDKILNKHISFMDNINNKVSKLDGFIRSRRIQILPNNYQKTILKNWFYDTTCIYNKLVSHFTQVYSKYQNIINNDDKISDNNKSVELGKFLKKNNEFPINFFELRKLKINQFTEDYQIPYCIIADIIKELVSNIKGNCTRMIKREITNFKLNHKDFNRIQKSITVESCYTTEKGFYPSIMGEILTNDSTFKWKNIEHDYKLIYNKYKKKYYIQIPKYIFQKDSNKKNPIAIMDAGERVFQTLYGLDHVIMIGENMKKPISKILSKIDNLKSKIEKKGNKKYNKKLNKKTKIKKHKYKKAIYRHHEKINHIQEEMHNKLSIYLCKNYDRIMVSDFSSKKVNNKDGNLGKLSKRILGKLSHYKFRQRLQNKCQEYGCQYLEVNEAYTSITCSNCGNIDKKLGAKKIYECKKCKYTTDRDINGAINILIKNRELIKK